jgi:hypothetical protein
LASSSRSGIKVLLGVLMFVLFLAVLFASDLITWTIRRKPRAESKLLRVARNPFRIDANRKDHFPQAGLPDGMRRPVSTGCDTLPMLNVLEAQ